MTFDGSSAAITPENLLRAAYALGGTEDGVTTLSRLCGDLTYKNSKIEVRELNQKTEFKQTENQRSTSSSDSSHTNIKAPTIKENSEPPPPKTNTEDIRQVLAPSSSDGPGILEGLKSHPSIVRAKEIRQSASLSTDASSYPIHFPIIPDNRFRGVLSALSSSLGPSKQVDIRASVRQFARRGHLGKVIYRKRRAIRGGIVIVADSGEGMFPFSLDISRFRKMSELILGTDRVSYAHFGSDGRFHGPKYWPWGGAIIILSDLHRWANVTGRSFPSRTEWKKVSEAATMNQMSISVLTPGLMLDRDERARVPTPAFPDLFSGTNPIARPVPWSDNLDRVKAAAFSSGKKRPYFESRSKNLSRNATTLFELTKLVTDIDPYTLRTLRKCLSAPKEVARAYHNRDVVDLDLTFADKLGPWHEFSVWTAPVFATRGKVSRFSQRSLPSSGAARSPSDRVREKFVRLTLEKARATRGIEQVLGDEWRWLNADPDATEKQKRQVAELVKGMAAEGAPSSSIRSIMGRDTSKAYLDPAERLTIRLDRDLLIVGVDDPNAEYSFKPPVGFDVSNAELSLFASESTFGDSDNDEFLDDPISPTLTHKLDLLPRQIEINSESVQTAILSFGDKRFGISLKRPPQEVPLLFERSLPYSSNTGELRFDGDRIALNGVWYDRLGLAKLGKAESVVPTAQSEDDEPQHLPKVTLENAKTLTVQRDWTSSALHSVDVPKEANAWTRYHARSGEGGTLLTSPNEIWVFTDSRSNDAMVWIDKWIAFDPVHSPYVIDGFRNGAVSSFGAVVTLKSDYRQSEIIVLPKSTPHETISPQIFKLSERLVDLALSTDGWLAVRTPTSLKIYALPTLDSSKDDDSIISTFDDVSHENHKHSVTIVRQDSQSRRWHQPDRHEVGELRDHLASDSLTGASHLYKMELSESDVSHEDFMISPLNLNQTEASALHAVVTQNAPRLKELLAEHSDLLELRLPGWNGTLLHVSVARIDSSSITQILLEEGADVEAGDLWGRTPLMLASMADDHGKTITMLLDAGANPKVVTQINRRVCGALPGALGELATNKAPVPDEVIDRLIKRGAPLGVFNAFANRTSLFYAVSRDNQALFPRILEATEDSLIDSGDDRGWTALTVALWKNQTDSAIALLNRGASPFVGPDTTNAITLLNQFPNAEVLDYILNQRDPKNDHSLRQSMLRLASSLDARYERLDQTNQQEREQLIARHAQMLPILYGALDGLNANIWEIALSKPWNADNPPAIFEILKRSGVRLNIVATMIKKQRRATVIFKEFLLNEDLRWAIDWPAKGIGGVTVGHLFAAIYKDPENAVVVLEMLAHEQVDLCAPDANGFTPLHYATAFENSELVKLLVERFPEMTMVIAGDGRMAGDMRSSNLDFVSGLPSSGAPATSPSPPTSNEQSSNSVLPSSVQWNVEPFEAETYFVESNKKTLPLAAADGAWLLCQRRRTKMPYKEPVYLQESWWRNDEHEIGVTIDLLDENNDQIFRANGKSPSIHEMNAKQTLALKSSSDAKNYLVFFCALVHGEDGPFTIVENEATYESLKLPEGLELDPSEGVSLEQDGETWLAKALVFYSRTLFLANFRIHPTGTIDMIDDEPISGDSDIGLSFARDGDVFRRVRE